MKHTVIVLTDLHLFADPDCLLKEVPTRASFAEVLNEAQRQYPNPDLVVLTGDLAHDELRKTYVDLVSLLDDWKDRLCVIPGNHDCRDSIRKIIPVRASDSITLKERCQFVERLGDWLLVGLDTHLPGELTGQIGSEQLEWLGDLLSSEPDRPTLVFTHHPPRSISSTWLDGMGLEDGAALCEMLAEHAQVQAVVSGHVHQEFDECDERTQGGAIRCMTTPSTCIQFRPRSDEPAYDQVPPGFRVVEFDGEEMVTRVVRLPELKYPSRRDPQ